MTKAKTAIPFNVPVKYRGVSVETGEPITASGVYIDDNGVYLIREFKFIEVDGSTLAQLVGHDANGAEVYEGDELYCDWPEYKLHKEYKAVFRREALAEDGCFHVIEKVYKK